MAQAYAAVLSRTIGPSRTAPFVGLHLHLRVDVLGDRSEPGLVRGVAGAIRFAENRAL